MITTPEQVAEQLAYLRERRSQAGPFDVALTGYTRPGQAERPRAFAAAGVTWWLESLHGFRGSFDELMARVRAGPPA